METSKPKIVFVLPNLGASHFRNRIMDFINNGYEICVYGFERHGNKLNLLYPINSLGTVTRKRYLSRVMLYIKSMYKIYHQHRKENVVYYLGNLDIAMFFHFVNPTAQYIYEECDLSHTYSKKLSSPLEIIDKKIISNSLLTVTTSEGFIQYHYGNNVPKNIYLIENKLNPGVKNFPIKQHREFNKESLVIGFVGGPRYASVHNFIEVFCKAFPMYEFHVFGGPILEEFEDLKSVPNCFFHGFFINPDNLPEIYSSIDLLLCTYDVAIENVRYAEPNKLYESIFYEKPIIVSKGTFLEKKVNRLDIGYSIDALDDKAIISFVNDLTYDSICKKINNARLIDKDSLIDSNEAFFQKLKQEFHL